MIERKLYEHYTSGANNPRSFVTGLQAKREYTVISHSESIYEKGIIIYEGIDRDTGEKYLVCLPKRFKQLSKRRRLALNYKMKGTLLLAILIPLPIWIWARWWRAVFLSLIPGLVVIYFILSPMMIVRRAYNNSKGPVHKIIATMMVDEHKGNIFKHIPQKERKLWLVNYALGMLPLVSCIILGLMMGAG